MPASLKVLRMIGPQSNDRSSRSSRTAGNFRVPRLFLVRATPRPELPMSRGRATVSAQVTPSLIGAHPAGGSSPLAEDGPAQPGSAPEPKSGSLSVSRHGFVLCDSLNCATPPAGPTDGVRSTLRGLAHVSTPPGQHDLTASQGSRDYQHRHPRSVTSAPARRGSRSGASGYKQTKSRCDKYH